MIAINLIPLDKKKEILGLSDLKLGVHVLVAFFVLIVALYALTISGIKDLETEIPGLNARIGALEGTKKKVEEIKARNKELDEKISIINMLEENRHRPLLIMEALGQAIPDRAWIEKFSEKNSTARIEGVAWDELTVSDFIKKLESFPCFQNIELRAISNKEIKKLPLKAFLIESKLNYSIKLIGEDKPREKTDAIHHTIRQNTGGWK
jgi:type IV pilus assembly protein PilN